MTTQPVPAVILAGGEGRRLHGDKPFAPLCGRPLIAHVIARLRPQASPLAISAKEPSARLEAFGLPLLLDGHLDGPRGGILAAIEWAQRLGAGHVLTVPCDTPFLPPDLSARLCAISGGADRSAAALSGGRRHPTIALWPASMRVIASLTDDPNASLHSAHDQLKSLSVEWPGGDGDPFFNVNTPQDLNHAGRRFAQGHGA